MEITKTEARRGFDLIKFKDNYNQKCSIQKSSAADESPKYCLSCNASSKLVKLLNRKHILKMEKVDIGTLVINHTTDHGIVSHLFINGLFSDDLGEMEFYRVDGVNGIEYHAKFDGHEGMGATPALALKDLLQSVVNGLYFAENGRP